MTKLTITLAQLEALKPCALSARRLLFSGYEPGHAMTIRQALKLGVSTRDVLWVLGRVGRKDLCVTFALYAAQRVEKYSRQPEQFKACLDAVRTWLADPSEDNRRACRKAAAAAAAAAAADDAAYAAAADDAYAAYAAADDAAYAAYAAAAAAAAAADEREYHKRLLIALCDGKELPQ